MDAGVYCAADDIDDADDNGRESVVWRLPGFYSHFPSPGRAPNYPPYWGMEGDTGGQVGYRWEGDTGGQVPPNSCLFRGLYYRWDMKVDQVTPFILTPECCRVSFPDCNSILRLEPLPL